MRSKRIRARTLLSGSPGNTRNQYWDFLSQGKKQFLGQAATKRKTS
jgi:hypothetical protein